MSRQFYGNKTTIMMNIIKLEIFLISDKTPKYETSTEKEIVLFNCREEKGYTTSFDKKNKCEIRWCLMFTLMSLWCSRLFFRFFLSQFKVIVHIAKDIYWIENLASCSNRSETVVASIQIISYWRTVRVTYKITEVNERASVYCNDTR